MSDTTQMIRRLERKVFQTGIIGGGGWQSYDLAVKADSMGGYNPDLKDSWITPQRWSMLTRQYLDGEAVEAWLDLIEAKLTKPGKTHGIAHLRSRVVVPRHSGARASRKWGSCMLGWSWRLYPTPTLVMHSRSTYLGYLADWDLLVAHKLAEKAGETVGLELEDIRFVWYLEQATLHDWRSLPWWYREENKGLLHTGNGGAQRARHTVKRFEAMDAAGRLYGDQPFTQERRTRMKFHTGTGVDGTPFMGEGSHATVDKPIALPSVKGQTLQLRYGDAEGTEVGFCDED